MRQFFVSVSTIATLMFLASCDSGGVVTDKVIASAPIAEGAATDMAAAPALERRIAPPSPAAGIVVIAPVVAPVVVVEESASSIVSHPPSRTRARVLTAGDIDDNLNLAAFSRYVKHARGQVKLPSANFSRPMRAQLTGPDGRAAPGLRVTLSRPGSAEPFYDGYSGVDGRIVVFPALHGVGGIRSADLKVFPAGQDQVFSSRVNSSARVVALPFAGGWQPDFLDLAFVIDTTGSMADELDWLTKELASIVNQAKRTAPGVNIRYGLIAYRDHGDQYVVRNFGFTGSQGQMRSWLRAQKAAGGGDYPEAAAQALQAAAGLDWRRGRGERLVFHIADAPTHDADARAYLNAARALSQKGVQIFGLGASGVAAESEYLMRQAAAGSNGRYLFLTDDSGVGYGHAEPTISCYQVTKLNGLMVRVLASELSGHRVEASAGKVIRSVGSYQGGVCRN